MSYQPPIEIDLSEAVVLVNRYSDEFRNEDGTPNDEIVAVNLGWTLEQLQEFRHDFEDLLEAEKEIAKLAPPKVRAPTDIDVMLPGPGSLPKEAPQLNDIAQAVEAADTALRKGFHNLGLTSREVEEAVAMQKFNGQYFKESMDLSSCNVMRTSVRLATQQGLIQARLEFVREQIDRANKGALKESGLTKEEQEAKQTCHPRSPDQRACERRVPRNKPNARTPAQRARGSATFQRRTFARGGLIRCHV